jgi:hypothetical protein
VRPLRPVRFLPAGKNTPDEVLTCLQGRVLHIGTVLAGSAPAFGRALAPWDGSDLLPLRLPSTLQWGDAFFAPPRCRDRGECCHTPAISRVPVSFSRRLACTRRPFGGLQAVQNRFTGWLTVAAGTLWVTVSVRCSKLASHLTRLDRGFLLRSSSLSS